MNVRELLAIVLLAGALTSCTVHSAGEPTGASGTPTSSTSAPGSSTLLPPRARDLDLTGLDPCADLLTDRQLRELDYDLGYARPPRPEPSRIHSGPTCTFSSTDLVGGDGRNMLTLVGISTTDGALDAADGAGRADVVTIVDLFALVLPSPTLPDSCLVVVDTADGQYLEVSTSPVSSEGTGRATYCAEAERVARMAIQTISVSG